MNWFFSKGAAPLVFSISFALAHHASASRPGGESLTYMAEPYVIHSRDLVAQRKRAREEPERPEESERLKYLKGKLKVARTEGQRFISINEGQTRPPSVETTRPAAPQDENKEPSDHEKPRTRMEQLEDLIFSEEVNFSQKCTHVKPDEHDLPGGGKANGDDSDDDTRGSVDSCESFKVFEVEMLVYLRERGAQQFRRELWNQPFLRLVVQLLEKRNQKMGKTLLSEAVDTSHPPKMLDETPGWLQEYASLSENLAVSEQEIVLRRGLSLLQFRDVIGEELYKNIREALERVIENEHILWDIGGGDNTIVGRAMLEIRTLDGPPPFKISVPPGTPNAAGVVVAPAEPSYESRRLAVDIGGDD